MVETSVRDIAHRFAELYIVKLEMHGICCGRTTSASSSLRSSSRVARSRWTDSRTDEDSILSSYGVGYGCGAFDNSSGQSGADPINVEEATEAIVVHATGAAATRTRRHCHAKARSKLLC